MINQNTHNNLSLVTDPIEDANLVLNFYNSNKKTDVSIRTVRNYANLAILNDDNITSVNMSSARLKSLSRIIASESERTLCTHVLMTMSCQFRVGKWINRPNNLSKGAIVAEKTS